jgi:outer membrane protein assembly factor BamB
LNTSTGVDNTHKSIRTPDAPSLVVIDRHSGRLLARDHAGIAPNIFHAAWSSPSHAVVDGRSLIFLGGGDGWLYAFEPLRATPPQGDIAALSNVWRFDCDPTAPKQDVHRFNGNRREGPSNILGMPVVHDGKVYVAAGGDLWWGKNEARLHCIDAAKAVSGDVTGSAGRWSHPLRRHGLSTPSIHGDLLFIADAGHTIHCLDLRSGQPIWTQETNGEIWASTLVADGKVFVGTRRGVFYVMSASREKRVLSTLTMNSPISASAVAANGVVYVATMKHLYAIATSR